MKLLLYCIALNLSFSDVAYILNWYYWAFLRYGSTIRIQWSIKAIFNIYTR